jgi:sterol desaturase/sphingolipid hydroxylase (fatty acid hydroxylase superfamily)
MRELVDHVAGLGAWGCLIVLALSTVYFLLLYFGFAESATFLTSRVFPAIGVGDVVDKRPLRDNQISREIRHSLNSIAIFGCYGLLTFLAYRSGVVDISFNASPQKTALNTIFLFFWNEMHFYASHRLLHTRYLYRHVHRIHHESAVPTAYSTYSFHWFEAVLLGSVMIIPMLFYSFSAIALLALPLLSIFFNTIGHWNYNVFARRADHMHSASVTHGLHHRRVAGNYGFYLPFIDRLSGTSLRK